jgi:ketosteroid isomerase-like protein
MPRRFIARQAALALLVPLTLAGCMSAQQPTAAVAPPPPSAQALAASADQARTSLMAAQAAFIAAYDAADADRFAALFDNNATYSGLTQTTWVQGKDQIRSMWTIAFGRNKSRDFAYQGDPLVNLSADNRTAVVTGYAAMRMAGPANVAVNRMKLLPMRTSVTWVQTPDGWKILNMHMSPMPAKVAPAYLPGYKPAALTGTKAG